MPVPIRAIRRSLASSAFLSEARHSLAGTMKMIEHCLDQLGDEDVWWRQHESHNSIQNILLHLYGNGSSTASAGSPTCGTA
jgi:hypothetical protein